MIVTPMVAVRPEQLGPGRDLQDVAQLEALDVAVADVALGHDLVAGCVEGPGRRAQDLVLDVGVEPRRLRRRPAVAQLGADLVADEALLLQVGDRHLLLAAARDAEAGQVGQRRRPEALAHARVDVELLGHVDEAPDVGRQLVPAVVDADLVILQNEDVDAVFTPAPDVMYPDGAQTIVETTVLANVLHGLVRPGHFRGVATVVTKLLNIVTPDIAIFGEKDYQQLQVIKTLARDLFLPVQIVGIETVRHADGLAMSSRNARLTHEDREAALVLNRALSHAISP